MLVFLKENYIYIRYLHIYEKKFKKTRRKFKILFKKLRKCIQYVQ